MALSYHTSRAFAIPALVIPAEIEYNPLGPGADPGEGGAAMKVQISADSTCDLSPELCEKYNIVIAPLSVIIDGNSYKDGVDVHPETIFRAVDNGKKVLFANRVIVTR